jgi:fumarate reductase flavoprotein subunit
MGIIRDQIPQFEFSIPVAVIGAGACGLSAALAVRDAGVEVLVFERDERPWGSTSMSLGAACAAGSASQAAAGVDDSADRFVADILAKTEGRADAALARVIGDRSGPTIDWLATHQVPMLLDFKWTGLGHSKPRLHIPPGRNGEELLTLLLNACARAGAEVMTSARVVDLYADAEDRVLGLRIARPNGEFEEIGCEAVVIATCGFGADHAMVA